ncbi:hypothetical protein OQ273_14550 [Hoeflea prorocentri]|uniref:Uncharacterized protein n=1 Tax=Hoeflea prorocentri TaxID=1922333 RepID=A0A9X3UJH8_9HYPH|nr:hypothetical protein [Hoeflea prorocentri]MCY6381998.1 hypothetical protein [Hoeflea prorocentri]MDA5399798.1 hypothetical protein [Hoeflea prorocentri]
MSARAAFLDTFLNISFNPYTAKTNLVGADNHIVLSADGRIDLVDMQTGEKLQPFVKEDVIRQIVDVLGPFQQVFGTFSIDEVTARTPMCGQKDLQGVAKGTRIVPYGTTHRTEESLRFDDIGIVWNPLIRGKKALRSVGKMDVIFRNESPAILSLSNPAPRFAVAEETSNVRPADWQLGPATLASVVFYFPDREGHPIDSGNADNIKTEIPGCTHEPFKPVRGPVEVYQVCLHESPDGYRLSCCFGLKVTPLSVKWLPVARQGLTRRIGPPLRMKAGKRSFDDCFQWR